MRSYLKVLGIGVAGIAAVCFIVSYAELVSQKIQIGFLQLPPIALAMLFLLLLVNGAARRLHLVGLSPQELALIYCMWLLAAMISSRGLIERFLPLLVGVNYYAEPTNGWDRLYFGFIKPPLVPWDTHGPAKQWLTTRFFEGLRAGEGVPWLPWLIPFAAWAVLVGAVFFAFLCLSVIMRRQWADHERLTFPLARLPLEMVRGDGDFFRNRLTWLGFALPTLVYLFNGLHMSFPTLPEIRLEIPLNEYLRAYPWDAVSFLTAYLSFAGIGFFYLLPADLLFSFWFFFALGKTSDGLLNSQGVTIQGMPHAAANLHTGYQTVGAFLVLSGYLFYTSWPHFRRVLAAAFRGREDPGQDEIIPYRAAVWGLLVSLAVAVGWCHLAGMSLWLAAFELLAYLFVQAIIMARCTAEGGLLMTEGSFTPKDILALGYPLGTLGPANLTTLAFLDGMFTRDLRGMLLTGFLDAQKLGDELGLRRRRLLSVFVIAIVAAALFAGVMQLYLPYHLGADNLFGFGYRQNALQFFRENQPLLQGGESYRWGALGWFGFGVLFTTFLGIMRMRFSWWPLHPLGYAMMASWATIVFWAPIFIAWVLKSLTVHYGGMKSYNRVRPFFLGLILGEFMAAVTWTLLDAAFHLPVPRLPWP